MTKPRQADGQVLWGDCLELLKLYPDGAFDHTVTDPPYSTTTHSKSRRGLTNYKEKKGAAARKARKRDLGFEALTDEARRELAVELHRVTKRWILVFSDDRGIPGWVEAFRFAGIEWVRTGLWVKPGATPQLTGDRPASGAEFIMIGHRTKPDRSPMKKRWNGGGRHAVWTVPIVIDRGHNGARLHTTQKPLALMEGLIREFTDEGEWVLDPFAGSGTTLVACRRNGRRSIGIELQESYVEVAQRRVDATTEQRALPFT